MENIATLSISLRAIRTAHSVVPGRFLMPILRRIAGTKDWRVRLGKSSAYVSARVDSLMEAAVLLTGYWERHESQTIDERIVIGDVVIDIGANVGLHAMRMAARVGTQGRVFAFEPNPEVFRRLTRNIQLNGYSHVTAIQAGVGENGTATLYVNPSSNWNRNATLLADPEESNAVATGVKLIPLDAFWIEHGRPFVKFIKIDIEGYELAALKTGREMLESCHPFILSEFSEHYCALQGIAWKDILAFYDDLGYRLADLEGASLERRQPPPGAVGYSFIAVSHTHDRL